MPNGFGRRGMGFGFRGSSPPWPYIGLGRGGLPRCGYFFSGVAGVPVAWPYQQAYWQAMQAGQVPYPAPGAASFVPQMTSDHELDLLRKQADMIKGQLERIESRVRELEAKPGS